MLLLICPNLKRIILKMYIFRCKTQLYNRMRPSIGHAFFNGDFNINDIKNSLKAQDA